MIKRIFLDLDDVLNIFTPWVLRCVGRDIHLDGREHNPEWGFDIVTAANELPVTETGTELGWNVTFTPETFWANLGREVWRDAPISEEFRYLIHKSQEAVGKENVFILTSPTSCPESAAGKVEWIQTYCPEWLHRQYLIGPPKWVCAHESLLFDDSDDNVKAFRAAGGHACLVPRPWNSNHGKSSWGRIEGTFSILSMARARHASTELRV